MESVHLRIGQQCHFELLNREFSAFRVVFRGVTAVKSESNRRATGDVDGVRLSHLPSGRPTERLPLDGRGVRCPQRNYRGLTPRQCDTSAFGSRVRPDFETQ